MGAGSSIRRGMVGNAKQQGPASEALQKLIKGRQKWRENGTQWYAWLDQAAEAALEPELEIV